MMSNNDFKNVQFQKKQDFIKAHCTNSQLKYKNYEVNKEMTQHIFPEVSFENKMCNVCDPNCHFSLTNNKLTTEERLLTPKNSNDWVKDALKKTQGFTFNPSPIISWIENSTLNPNTFVGTNHSSEKF